MATVDDLPADPFACLPESSPLQVAERRELPLFGATVELLWLPQRRDRPGIPTSNRPPYRPSRVETILAEEAVWRGGTTESPLVMTANRFPFADRQLVIWSGRPVREPDVTMLEYGFEIAARVDGTMLMNSVGAAASISRAHLHVIQDRREWLQTMPTIPERDGVLDATHRHDGLDIQVLAPPYPVFVHALTGTPAARARAVHRLLELRTATAFNLVADRETTFVLPRSAVEIPAPHFPHALGAAEIWGRWCFADRAAFDATSIEDLEAALRLGGFPGRTSSR